MTKVGFGCDHAAVELKNILLSYMREKGYECVDFGTDYDENGIVIPCDYPQKGKEVAEALTRGEIRFGVLMCGTGIGISLAANKVPGVRAAACGEPYSAMMARRHNDANIIAVGARVVGTELAKMILDAFFDSEFEGGRHLRRVEMIREIEREYNR